MQQGDTGQFLVATRQTYDANNQLTSQSWQMGSTAYSETYTYSKTTGLLATHTPAVGNLLTFGYDALQRLSTVTGGIYGKTYTYRDVGNNTTTQVSKLTYDLATDIVYNYTYDVLGNIATYTQGGTTYTYTYDAQNQLLSQTGGGKTYTYTYDAAGNILTSSDGTTSHSYTYGNSVWKDLLTAFDGETITYDGAGNPTSYYNGTRWTFAWEEGRRLISASGGGKSISYTYDSEGLRLSKTVGSTKHNYYYAGGKLMRETWGSNTLDFFYDAQGTPYAVKYNGTLYYYITNLQGDVLHIVDTSGNTVVSYTYDPYGKPLTTTGSLASTLGAANPLRYRGYYFDTDSGLYYLQSRYYDPELCRFINADSYASTGQGIIGTNMFAYCNNNPCNYFDANGRELVSISVMVGAVVVFCIFIPLLDWTAQNLAKLLQELSTKWQYAHARISFIYEEETDEVEETLPRQGLVEGDPDAPPVNAGKQGKHVEGHNNHQEGKSTWPDGQTGVQQTQEAWQNGVPDPKKPDGSVRIGIASDGTVVRVHIGSDGSIHGYPYYP